MPSARRTVDIDAPPDVVMEVVTDFAAYPRFLTDMESAEIVRAEPDDWEVQFTVRVIRRLSYTLRLFRPSPGCLRWALIEGAFKSNDGGWDLAGLDDGRRTRATYAVDLQVGMFVPGNIVKSLVDHSLPRTLSQFKAEAERRHALGGLS